MPGELSSAQVSQIAGVSLRQLQWWDEQGIVTPRQLRHSRVYQPEDVLRIRLIAECRKRGIGLKHVRMILADLRKLIVRAPYVVIQIRQPYQRPLVTSFDTPASAFMAASKSKYLCALLLWREYSEGPAVV